ncbi:MAG: hypothetical protein UHW60_06065 [Methanobrevibacter sp.]|nr:hypothetical protein [Methanobrevibacter sp.]
MAKKFDIEEVKKSIIKSLHKNRYYNKRHTPIKNVCKRLPKIPCKYIKKAIKELKNENIIKIKPTYHDADIYLNVKMKKEIDEYLNQIDY